MRVHILHITSHLLCPPFCRCQSPKTLHRALDQMLQHGVNINVLWCVYVYVHVLCVRVCVWMCVCVCVCVSE